MRHRLLIPSAAVLICLSAPAIAADCQTKLQYLDNRIISNDKGYRIAVSSGIGFEIRRLHAAADVFARNGLEESCEEVVDGINLLIEDRIDELAKEQKLLSSDEWYAAEKVRLQDAEPVENVQRSLLGAQLIGADIRNLKNKDLGEIEDVVLDPQKKEVRYVVVSHGGFLGLSDKLIAVPWNKLKTTMDDGERVYVLNMSEEDLEKAPSFERGESFEIDMEEWRTRNGAFFEENL